MSEICCGSYYDVMQAASGGAGRIELNCVLYLGGLTSSLAFLELMREHCNMRVIATVRPRDDGFCYSEEDFNVMLRECEHLARHGADGIAFGCLREDASIDRERNARMISIIYSHGKEVVFHRVSDYASNPYEFIETLIELGADRLLTSGPKSKVVEGKALLDVLQPFYGNSIEILTGSDINASNVRMLMKETGIRQVRSSCKDRMTDPTIASHGVIYDFAELSHENCCGVVSEALVRKFLDSLGELRRWAMIAEYKKSILVRRLITTPAVVASVLLQTYIIQVSIRPANLLSSGFTGVAILIDRIAFLYGHNISTSLGMLVLNIPMTILCNRSTSMHFTFYSMLRVLLASFFLKVCSFQPLLDDVPLDAAFGGFLCGLPIAIALRGSASIGSTDFTILYASNKIGRSIWEYVFAGNYVVLYTFGYMFGWLYAGYSILLQLVSTKAISAFHHRYERVALQITTTKALEIINQYVKRYRHGIPCVDAVGGYSHRKMYLPHTVVSSYEVNDIVHLIWEQDPHIIVNMIRTENFYGGFYQAPIKQ